MGRDQFDDFAKLGVKGRLPAGEGHEADWLVRPHLRQHLVHNRHGQVVVRPVLCSDAVHTTEITAAGQFENEFDARRGHRPRHQWYGPRFHRTPCLRAWRWVMSHALEERGKAARVACQVLTGQKPIVSGLAYQLSQDAQMTGRHLGIHRHQGTLLDQVMQRLGLAHGDELTLRHVHNSWEQE